MKPSTLVKFREGYCSEKEKDRIFVVFECDDDSEKAYIVPLYNQSRTLQPIELVRYCMIEEI